jgi:hypothetical protein
VSNSTAELGSKTGPQRDDDDPLLAIPPHEYIRWLAPEGCPVHGENLQVVLPPGRGTLGAYWACGSACDECGAVGCHSGDIYDLAALVAGVEHPLHELDREWLSECLTDGWAARFGRSDPARSLVAYRNQWLSACELVEQFTARLEHERKYGRGPFPPLVDVVARARGYLALNEAYLEQAGLDWERNR